MQLGKPRLVLVNAFGFICRPIFSSAENEKARATVCQWITGLWVQDRWPLPTFAAPDSRSVYISTRTPFLVSNGTTTCRLHLRHFNSTPSATTRASKLPQPQRSEVSCLVVAASLARFCCSGVCMSDGFLALCRQPERAGNEGAEHESLSC